MAREHFVTLFDSNFLPQGIALAETLRRHCPESELWVLCMDQEVEGILAALQIAGVRTISLGEVEDARLQAAKKGRSAREYCWTLTAFTFDAVFARSAEAQRVTYVDADLCFFDSPRRLFEELESSGRSILVTEHNFDPRYDRAETVGRFCVQFLTMDRSPRAREVRLWWQERVLQWCYDRCEPGLFGDQKYLDQWPALFGDRLHILQNRGLALAPWNVRMESRKASGTVAPSFYHFHSFRVLTSTRARLVEGGYNIPRAGLFLYGLYVTEIHRAIGRMRDAGIRVPFQPIAQKRLPGVRHCAKKLLGRADRVARLRG